jgi:tRNA threonylcarbamoyl adenosine modification protein YeaZ
MKILALDFSSSQLSAAVRETVSQHVTAAEVLETGGRSSKAFAMIEDALRQAQLEREQIECVAVGLGPGSYTGIRASIAIAQGWQLARAVKLLGISSAECVAAQAAADGLRGRVAVVIDAQRNEFYLANYELKDDAPRELRPLRLASLEDVRSAAKEGHLIVGPEVTRWFPDGKILFPRAAMLATLALSRTGFVPGEKLEPIYLRQTQFVKAPPPRIIA